MNSMDLYRTFYFAAKTGSLSRAAEELYITQPAVSHAIKLLETQMDVALFIRTPRGVRLTSEGEVLFQHVEQAYQLLTSAEKKIKSMQNLEWGEIEIGAGDTLCRYYLLPFLETFHQDFPSIKIRITNRTTPETVKLLKEGKIDFGIVNLPLEDEQLVVTPALPLQDCFVAGTKYQELKDQEISFQELLNYPILLLEKGSNTRAFLDNYAHSLGASLQPEFELGSIDLLIEFARIGLGIACVTRTFFEEELLQGHIFEIRLKHPLPVRHIGIITLKDVPLSTAANQLISRLFPSV